MAASGGLLVTLLNVLKGMGLTTLVIGGTAMTIEAITAKENGEPGWIAKHVGPVFKDLIDAVGQTWAKLDDRAQAADLAKALREKNQDKVLEVFVAEQRKRIDQMAEINTANISAQDQAWSGMRAADSLWSGFLGDIARMIIHKFAPESDMANWLDQRIALANARIQSGFYNQKLVNTTMAQGAIPVASQLQAMNQAPTTGGVVAAPGTVNNGMTVAQPGGTTGPATGSPQRGVLTPPFNSPPVPTTPGSGGSSGGVAPQRVPSLDLLWQN